MTCEKARKLCGEDMFYLADPYVNLDVLDLYQKDTGAAWLLVAKFMYNFMSSNNPKIVSHIKKVGNVSYYWISYDLVISRLWHYGIRSRSTICNAFSALCTPSDELPPLLLKYSEINTYGRPMVYYTSTEMFRNLFVQHPTSILKQNQARMEAGESSDVESTDAKSDTEAPVNYTQKCSEIPDDWFPIFAQIRECGFYKDKADRDAKGSVFGYNQKLYTYISEILNGTFYENSGRKITNRYNLEGLTKEQILEWITKENHIPAGGEDYAYRTIVYTTSKATYSPLLNALCGGGTTSAAKSTKNPRIQPDKYRPELKDPTPSFVWAEGYSSVQNTPDRHYPEFSLNSPMFWGLYREVQEYHEACTAPDGIWLHNNTSGKPPVSVLKIVMAMLEAAKDAGISYDELVREVKVGVDKNWIWALTIQKVFTAQNSYKIGRGVTGDLYKHLYNAWPLAKEYYKE